MGDNPARDEQGGPERSQQDGDFLIVGLGASAGGIQALREFFARVGGPTGMAYVVILHLSPEHESRLAEILQTVTPLPVTQVTETVRVRPDHVYVIPQNQSLTMSDGTLALSHAGFEERRAPVDIFLRTLADSHDARAVGVILSGTGANGSMGLKRLKEHGGIVLAQDPQEAEYDDMPRHAIATGLVDYVLPVAAMPARIAAYAEQFRRAPAPPASPERAAPPDEAALRDIFVQMRLRTGHDFTNYKRATLLRRIGRRMNVHGLSEIAAYARLLRGHAEESAALLRDLLISVTNFFRDREAFHALEQEVVPRLFEDKAEGEFVRVWVAGCATGEEAYSVAMLLAERNWGLLNAPAVQIFASDIDQRAITAAREGYYTLSDVADVPPERLSRFFTREGDGYRVRPELREMVLFAHHNLIKDPPFSHIDLLTCRNLLIYLNRTAQQRVLEVAHFALNPGGYLFLGTSESADGGPNLFITFDREAHIFRSRAGAPRTSLPIPETALPDAPGERRQVAQLAEDARAARRASYADLHLRLLEQYAPPSVIVNEEHEILHLSERAGRYLQVAGGEPSRNLLQLARPELRLELRTALYQAARERTHVEVRGVSVPLDGRTETISILVRPVLGRDDTARGFFLVLFEPGAASRPAPAASAAGPAARGLEEELIRVKSHLRLTVEQYETSAEELRVSNEELQAINEELRSTTEELETSKEELQSINEELTTVNQELKVKIEELSHTNNDLQNLMNSTHVATVFLDRGLRVKFYTPEALRIFNLLPVDTGRPLADITHNLADETPIAEARRVLDSLQVSEREVRTQAGETYLMSLLPYRTTEDLIDGVVLTFFDITERTRAREALRQSEEQFRRTVEDAPIPVIMHAEDGEVLQISRTWTELTGYALEDVPTLDAWLTRAYGEGADAVREHMRGLFTGDRRAPAVEFPVRTRDGAVRHWSFSASSPGQLRDGRRFIIGTAVDITDGKRSGEELQRSEQRLRSVVESITGYAIITQDAEGRIETWNAGAETMCGYTADEALGQSIGIIFTPEDRAGGVHLEEMRRAREEGRALDERWHVRKDGSRFYASGILSPLGGRTPTGYVKIARDLTRQKQAEDALRRAHDGLEERIRGRTLELAETNVALEAEVRERRAAEERVNNLLRQLVTVQEDERRRIARDLHDHLGQQMTALRLNLESLKQDCDADERARAKIEQAQETAARLDADVDFLAWELRPAALDDLGLAATLADFVNEFSNHFGIKAEFHARGFGRERLAPEIETNLYRIAQEALTNVHKHAVAGKVAVLLELRDGQVVLIVEDNGSGFDPITSAAERGGDGARGMGLIGMRERAALIGGAVEIETAPDAGTTVFVRVPAEFARPINRKGGEKRE